MAAFASSSSSQKPSIDPNDCNIPQPGNDGISSLSWSPTANFLVSSNWDGGVRCWEVQEQGGRVQAQAKAMTSHEGKAPVLDTCFSSDGTAVFSGGCDKAVRMWQLQGAQQEVSQQIGMHDAPVKCVGFLPTNIVVSGGWDKKLKFWDPRQNPNQPVGTLDMPERVHALDIRGGLMAVATQDRQVICYDVTGQPREHVRKESPLKYQTRSLAVFPDQTGFAIGSTEGRVGIHYVQRVPGKESFAFKCHRKDNNVFAVDDICFNTQFGTFATVGADGVVSFWDKDNKQRLKGFDPIQRTISCASFSTQGNLFAYASSYDWSKGAGFYSPGTPNEIFVHFVKEDEIKQKGKKSGLKSR